MRWTVSTIVGVLMYALMSTACVPSGPGAVGPPAAAATDEAPMPPDMGTQCQRASDCNGGTCVKNQKFTLYGYCSKPCTDWPECPTYWSCEKNPVNEALACAQPKS